MCLKRWITWVHGLVWFGLLSCCLTSRGANGEERITFGRSWYHADSAEWHWILEHEQAGFFRSGEVLATLPIRQKMVALYSHTSTSKSSVYLSVFEQGQEQRLWETTTFPGTDVRLWNPILLSGNLTAHSSPDLLLVYWPNKISTSEGKFHTQFLHLFLDWQQATDDPIPLSALDLSISEPNAASVSYYAYKKPGEPAGQRYSFVLLLPASKDIPFSMYMWNLEQ